MKELGITLHKFIHLVGTRSHTSIPIIYYHFKKCLYVQENDRNDGRNVLIAGDQREVLVID